MDHSINISGKSGKLSGLTVCPPGAGGREGGKEGEGEWWRMSIQV
jgi:hypothetical protein